MKKFFILIILAVMSVAAYGGYALGTAGRNAEILRDGFKIHFLPDGRKLLPFSYDGKFGLVRNSTKPTVYLPPMFDGMKNTSMGLLPVRIGDRWGAVDLVQEHMYSKPQPIIPCVYDDIIPIDDEHVYGIINGRKIKLDVKDFI